MIVGHKRIHHMPSLEAVRLTHASWTLDSFIYIHRMHFLLDYIFHIFRFSHFSQPQYFIAINQREIIKQYAGCEPIHSAVTIASSAGCQRTQWIWMPSREESVSWATWLGLWCNWMELQCTAWSTIRIKILLFFSGIFCGVFLQNILPAVQPKKKGNK